LPILCGAVGEELRLFWKETMPLNLNEMLGVIGTVLSVFVTVFAVILAAYLGHYLSVRRDRQYRRDERQTEYLIDTWRRLVDASFDPLMKKSDVRKLNAALSDVQLFGTAEQANLAARIVEEASTSKGASGNELVELMRDDLRKMLNLDALGEQRYVYLRWHGEDEGDEKTPSSF
jgi:hypothetical protein